MSHSKEVAGMNHPAHCISRCVSDVSLEDRLLLTVSVDPVLDHYNLEGARDCNG